VIKMYCPKCGKEIPEGSRFCMHCGADLSEYKVEVSPNINVSPKVSAYAKAEGVPYPKWKPKVENYVEIKGEGKLPVYERFAEFNGKPFCPQCGNYDSLDNMGLRGQIMNKRYEWILDKYTIYKCLACDKSCLISSGYYPFQGYEILEIWSISKGDGFMWIISETFDFFGKADIAIFGLHNSPGLSICPICGKGSLIKGEPKGKAYMYSPIDVHHDKGTLTCSASLREYGTSECSNCKTKIFVEEGTETFYSSGDVEINALKIMHNTLLETGQILLVNKNDICNVCGSTIYMMICPKCKNKFSGFEWIQGGDFAED